MTKQEARTIIKARMKHLSPEYKKKSDDFIRKRVQELEEYQQADIMFCYVSTHDEVDTWQLMEEAFQKGKRIGVPKCIGKGIMEVREIHALTELKEGAYGIMEPSGECPEMKKEEIQFGIIPCVSADTEGRRLGHGAGFYDRYLSGTSFCKVMLCRKELMLSEIPTDQHDIKMDKVIFEQ
jgi:5-formyltetrahydrofolate cyclo-ligase